MSPSRASIDQFVPGDSPHDFLYDYSVIMKEWHALSYSVVLAQHKSGSEHHYSTSLYPNLAPPPIVFCFRCVVF
eukprot:2726077-Amphidinium_carterae.1